MLSGFGQTFYIGLFNPQLRDSFALGHGELGLVYGGATLASAALLTRVGRLYDHIDLRLFLSGAAFLLAAGCLLIASSANVILLLLSLFLLRLGGQGLMTHIALTTMAQRFHGGRGKAVSIAAMGLPLPRPSSRPAPWPRWPGCNGASSGYWAASSCYSGFYRCCYGCCAALAAARFHLTIAMTTMGETGINARSCATGGFC